MNAAFFCKSILELVMKEQHFDLLDNEVFRQIIKSVASVAYRQALETESREQTHPQHLYLVPARSSNML